LKNDLHGLLLKIFEPFCFLDGPPQKAGPTEIPVQLSPCRSKDRPLRLKTWRPEGGRYKADEAAQAEA